MCHADRNTRVKYEHFCWAEVKCISFIDVILVRACLYPFSNSIYHNHNRSPSLMKICFSGRKTSQTERVRESYSIYSFCPCSMRIHASLTLCTHHHQPPQHKANGTCKPYQLPFTHFFLPTPPPRRQQPRLSDWLTDCLPQNSSATTDIMFVYKLTWCFRARRLISVSAGVRIKFEKYLSCTFTKPY